MKLVISLSAILLLSVCANSPAIAQDASSLQDPRAIEVLNSMVAYTRALDKFVIRGETSADARLEAGLMVSNPAEIMVSVDRPNALHVSQFDGVNTKHIYLNNGQLTVFGTERNFYAQGSVPKDIQEGMMFAMEKLAVDAPLVELLFPETAKELLMDETEIIYLTDKSRISGADCHHIVIRGPESDVQMWIEEGSKPVVRKMQVSMKWDNGSPRFFGLLSWESVNEFEKGDLDFIAPEGAQEIQFVGGEQ